MIERIQISNYQSLHDIEVELGGFTVIVGPSSSGKSAFTRALNTLTGNQRGTSFITHGQNQTTIIAKMDNGSVALSRGKKDEYLIITEEGEQKRYTKLAGGVPEEVSEFLGIAAKDPLNYANQFDMPYLLTASPPEVARTLGDLTNVSVIFEAARESNKRRLGASSKLKTRLEDHKNVKDQVEAFEGLDTRKKNLDKVETLLAEAQSLSQRSEALKRTLDALAVKPVAPKKTNYPDLAPVKKLAEETNLLKELVDRIESGVTEARRLKTAVDASAGKVAEAQEAHVQALRDLGVCPTCKQETAQLTHSH